MSDLIVRKDKSVEERQYVIFNLNKEFYGIDIIHINTIIMMPEITAVPLAPDYLKGIISLRGHIIPVIDMHTRMNYGPENITKDTRIIVINLESGEQVGIIVDSVKEVMVISDKEIEYPSPFVKTEETFISGVGKKNNCLISILAVHSLVDTEVLDNSVA